MSKKIILTAYIENTQLRRENQAILQTLETGVIQVEENGIKYFNNEGEKALIRCVYYSRFSDDLKR
jgi:sensor histidine kinase regulating citrate/malate metabolism